MIGHQDVSDQFAGPLHKQVGKVIDERLTTSVLIEDREAIEKVSRDVMQSTWEIEI